MSKWTHAGARMRELRQARPGLTVRQLGALAKVNHSTISLIEGGQSRAQPQTLQRLAPWLKTPLADLLALYDYPAEMAPMPQPHSEPLTDLRAALWQLDLAEELRRGLWAVVRGLAQRPEWEPAFAARWRWALDQLPRSEWVTVNATKLSDAEKDQVKLRVLHELLTSAPPDNA